MLTIRMGGRCSVSQMRKVEAWKGQGSGPIALSAPGDRRLSAPSLPAPSFLLSAAAAMPGGLNLSVLEAM